MVLRYIHAKLVRKVLTGYEQLDCKRIAHLKALLTHVYVIHMHGAYTVHGGLAWCFNPQACKQSQLMYHADILFYICRHRPRAISLPWPSQQSNLPHLYTCYQYTAAVLYFISYSVFVSVAMHCSRSHLSTFGPRGNVSLMCSSWHSLQDTMCLNQCWASHAVTANQIAASATPTTAPRVTCMMVTRSQKQDWDKVH